MSRDGLPLKRMRALETRLDTAERDTLIGMEVREYLGAGLGYGRTMRVGGLWSMSARRYVGSLPPGWRSSRPFTVGPNQYAVLLDFYEAMRNDERVDLGLPILQDILIHGGRRSGKSSALAPAGAMAMILWPGSAGMILGPLKRHGERIIGIIRRHMDPGTWTYDKRDSTLRLANTSWAYARNATNYDNEIGEGLRWMVIDEAATLDEIVYEKLAPSLYDHNGVCCMSSTPRKHNWFYKKYLKAKNSNNTGAVRAHRFPLTDNVFLSEAAKRRAIEAAETLSKTGYLEEVLGEFVPEAGQAFGDFTDENIRNVKQMPDDATPALCQMMFGAPYRYIAAVDFNFEPTIGAVVKFDSLGRPWICGEIVASSGATDKWGEYLAEFIRQQDDTAGMEPTAACVIVADASGHYQGTGRRAAQEVPTWQALIQQGWYVESPTGKLRKNPRREQRLEIIRSLVYNVAGERRLFVDPSCQLVISMFQELPLKNGVPDKTSQHVHTYDGATYGIYRVWGTGDGEIFYERPLIRRLDEVQS